MIPDGELCTHKGWVGLKPGDYSKAVIRLVTVLDNHSTFLVFGWIELLPKEMPPPPEVTRRVDFKPSRYFFNRIVMPLDDGLAWYDAACNGIFSIPNTEYSFVPGRLAPEPNSRRFALRNDVPFSPSWHVTPRVHRLVPKDEPPGLLTELVSNMVEKDRFKETRHWLEGQLHFDICAHDDWMGSLALIAPNPLLRSSRGYVAPIDVGGTLVGVSAQPREGVDCSTLSVRFQEHRAGALGWTDTRPMDLTGLAQTRALGGMDALEYQILCSERGLLDFQPPTPWISAVYFRMGVQSVDRAVATPPRRKSEQPKTYKSSVFNAIPPITIGSAPDDALARLRTLRSRREARSGERRPLDEGHMPEELKIFHNDREAAVSFIRERIARARTRVILVDPYFNPSDFAEFALATGWRGVAVSVLISQSVSHLESAPNSPLAGVATQGDHLVLQIESVRTQAKKLGMASVDVLVSRTEQRFHDRFLLIDDDLWLCGHSFNNVGTGEISTIVRLPKSDDLRRQIEGACQSATSYIEHWAKYRAISLKSTAPKPNNEGSEKTWPAAL